MHIRIWQCICICVSHSQQIDDRISLALYLSIYIYIYRERERFVVIPALVPNIRNPNRARLPQNPIRKTKTKTGDTSRGMRQCQPGFPES